MVTDLDALGVASGLADVADTDRVSDLIRRVIAAINQTDGAETNADRFTALVHVVAIGIDGMSAGASPDLLSRAFAHSLRVAIETKPKEAPPLTVIEGGLT